MSAALHQGPVLGVIADDSTGATDVASMLVRHGLRTIQFTGVPSEDTPPPAGASAVVVALKTRTSSAADAVNHSLKALQWLRTARVRQIYFKICSTFDSTPAGNIGPVVQALLDALQAPGCIITPAFPENGRTVFRGHLFVGDVPLHESGMRNHPLTPMTDSNIVRVLQAQSQAQVGLLAREGGSPAPTAQARVARLRERWRVLQSQGVRLGIADAVDEQDLLDWGEALAEEALLVGGSGLALGLPAAYARRGWVNVDADAARLPAAQSPLCAVLAGSCSEATLGQIAAWQAAGHAAFALDVAQVLQNPQGLVQSALAWARNQLAANQPPLIYSSLPAPALKQAQAQWAAGAVALGERVEQVMAQLAQGMVRAGARRMVVAGGETSSAVVAALGAQQLNIGPAICPGVPWTATQLPPNSPGAASETLHLALKSGNFGGPNFFAQALGLGAQAAGASHG